MREANPPALVFYNPKSAFNIGRAVRLASAYGFKQVWYTGERIANDIRKHGRIPREERMKGYRDVELINDDYPLTLFLTHASIICVEVLRSAQSLHSFVHPSNPVYVFGPEDDSLSREVKSLCHYFVTIPTRHCLNVADAATTIMWDRQHKLWLAGGDDFEHTTPGEFEMRGML